MKTSKKHTIRNLLLVILALLLIAVCVLAYAYRDVLAQIPMLINGMTHSEEEIAAKLEENDKKQNEILNELVEGTMRDLTDEERAMLASGELSKEDALALIQGLMPALPTVTEEVSAPVTEEPDTAVTSASATTDRDVTEPEPVATTAPEVTAGATEATTAETTAATTSATTAHKTEDPLTEAQRVAKQNRISEIIAEIYLLRATYLNKIDEVITSAKQKYNDLPREKRGLKAKLQIVDQYVRPTGNALEKECDAKMKVLLTELREILTELNMGTSLISDIEKAYKEQKELKMAELYSQYSPKLQ